METIMKTADWDALQRVLPDISGMQLWIKTWENDSVGCVVLMNEEHFLMFCNASEFDGLGDEYHYLKLVDERHVSTDAPIRLVIPDTPDAWTWKQYGKGDHIKGITLVQDSFAFRIESCDDNSIRRNKVTADVGLIISFNSTKPFIMHVVDGYAGAIEVHHDARHLRACEQSWFYTAVGLEGYSLAFPVDALEDEYYLESASRTYTKLW